MIGIQENHLNIIGKLLLNLMLKILLSKPVSMVMLFFYLMLPICKELQISLPVDNLLCLESNKYIQIPLKYKKLINNC